MNTEDQEILDALAVVPDLRISFMQEEDFDRVRQIDRLSGTSPMPPEMLRKFSAGGDRPEMADVAVRGGVVAGYSMYEVTPDLVFLSRLAVHPEYRRSGVGKKLVNHLMKRLDVERPVIRAIVSETSIDACNFLARCGFKADFRVSDSHPAGEGLAFHRFKRLPVFSMQELGHGKYVQKQAG